MTSGLRAVVAAAALAVALSACSGQPVEKPAAEPGSTSTEHPEGHTGAEGGHHGGPPGSLELWAVQSRPLGVVVTDGRGRVLYRHDGDSNQPPTSTCVDACTATWEPVLAGAEPVVPLGIDESKIGTLVRPDGGKQVTLAGWPLYAHVGGANGLQDAGAQGVDGVWFAIAPDGEKSTPPA